MFVLLLVDHNRRGEHRVLCGRWLDAGPPYGRVADRVRPGKGLARALPFASAAEAGAFALAIGGGHPYYRPDPLKPRNTYVLVPRDAGDPPYGRRPVPDPSVQQEMFA